MKNHGNMSNRKGIVRRDVLKGGTALAAAATASMFLPRYGSAQDGVLNLLSWPGWGHPDTVGPFEAKHGVKVQVKEYAGGEPMLALANSSPPGTFDVILTDAEYVQMLRAGDLIVELDPNDYPFEDYWPNYQRFPLHWEGDTLFSVMVRFGYLGLSYNMEQYTPKQLTSYSALWEADAAGKVGFFDWYLPSMGCLSLYNGNKSPFDIDEEAFGKLQETMNALAPQVAGYYSYANTYSSLANGQVWLIPGIGEWLTLGLRKDGVPVNTHIPDEGGIQWTESFSIARGAQSPELANEFIKWMASPEGQVRCALRPGNETGIASKKGWEKLNADHPVEAEWLRMRLDKRNMMDEWNEGKIVIRNLPAQQTIEDWTRAWAEMKSA